MSSTHEIDRSLKALLRTLPDDQGFEDALRLVSDWTGLVEASFEHGVAGVIHAGLHRAAPDVSAVELGKWQRRLRFEAVRQDAFQKDLRRILAVLAREGIPTVALKGPLLAARLYAGVVRPSTDLDILVEPASLDATVRALAPLGYSLEGGDTGRFFRDHHHHVHLLHRTLPVVELHVAAYQGFGASFPAGPLLARSVPCDLPDWGDFRLLSPEDEFLYLSVHAASHRFQRLGWLYDLKLFAGQHPSLRWDQVAARASEYGFTAVVTLACTLLTDWLGVKESWGAYLPPLGTARLQAVKRLLRPRSPHLADAAAAFLYSSLLCDDPSRVAAFAGRFFRVKMLHEIPMRIRSRFAR